MIATRKNRDEELVVAATNGRFERVKLLLYNRADVDYRDYHGSTALHAAAGRGCQESIALLLDADSRVNALNRWRETPLDVATTYKRSGAVQTLLTARAFFNNDVNGGGGNIWGPPLFAAATAHGGGSLPAVQAS